MALYMLHTGIAACLIRGKSPALDERVAAAASKELCISAVTRGELLCGLSRQTLQETEREMALPGRAGGEMARGKVPNVPKMSTGTPATACAVDQATMESLRKSTHAVLANLTPEEARALRTRFGIDMNSLGKVGKQFDVTRERPGFRGRTHHLSRVVEQFLSRVQCLPWDEAAATRFATVAVELHTAGTPIGTADTMIAAHAIAVGAVLVTNEERHFCRVSGLKIENWTQSSAPR